MNPYCRKEFRSEEYFHMKDKCSSCGSELKLKHEVEETTSQKIKDRASSLEILSFLQNYLKELTKLPFPLKPTLNAFNAPVQAEPSQPEKRGKKELDNDIDENLMKLIDFDLKFVKLSKSFFERGENEDFFLGNHERFSDTLKNVKKEVKAFFRHQDLKACFLKKQGVDFLRKKIERMNRAKLNCEKLSKEAYKKVYKERMASKFNIN